MRPNELYSVAGAALELGVSPRLVQKWIASGELRAYTPIGSNFLLITPKDLEQKRVRNPAGRPPKPKSA